MKKLMLIIVLIVTTIVSSCVLGGNQTPGISIINPLVNTIVIGDVLIEIDVNNTKDVASVKFYIDDILKETDTSAPYTYSWDTHRSYHAEAADNIHELLAKAYNEDGNEIASTMISVRVTIGEPNVTTHFVSDVSDSMAYCGGYIVNEGLSVITQRGICWSQTPFPTRSMSRDVDSNATTGSFSSVIVSLQPETSYNVRAYAVNAHGTGYGEIRSFTTPDEAP